MDVFALLIILALLCALALVARRYALPYPVLLVVAGLVVGLIPGMPLVRLHSKVVLLLFLPLLLYDASATISWHDLKRYRWQISLLAIGLVLATVAVMAAVAHYLVPGLGWPVAIVLGAVLAPPDAVAAASATQGLGLPKRLTAVLEGESLINDASALIVFRYALAAVFSGTFVLWEAGLHFVFMSAGSVALGVGLGYAGSWVHQRVSDPAVTTVLSLLLPFGAYFLAEHVDLSGVLTVVTTGLLVAWRAYRIYPVRARVQKDEFWRVVTFVLNGLVFLLIGLQLPAILQTKALAAYAWPDLLRYGLLLSLALVAVRFAWVFGVGWVEYRIRAWRGSRQMRAGRQRRELLVTAWAGMRGVVSLATALSLPRILPNGQPFPQHVLVVFLTFFVLVLTLLVQGSTLPWLVRQLHLQQPAGRGRAEERRLRRALASYAQAYITKQVAPKAPAWLVQHLHQVFTIPNAAELTTGLGPDLSGDFFYQILWQHLAVARAQQVHLTELRHRNAFEEESIHRLEQELDIVVLALELQTTALSKKEILA